MVDSKDEISSKESDLEIAMCVKSFSKAFW